jgi:hypothetical protein
VLRLAPFTEREIRTAVNTTVRLIETAPTKVPPPASSRLPESSKERSVAQRLPSRLEKDLSPVSPPPNRSRTSVHHWLTMAGAGFDEILGDKRIGHSHSANAGTLANRHAFRRFRGNDGALTSRVSGPPAVQSPQQPMAAHSSKFIPFHTLEKHPGGCRKSIRFAAPARYLIQLGPLREASKLGVVPARWERWSPFGPPLTRFRTSVHVWLMTDELGSMDSRLQKNTLQPFSKHPYSR